MTYHSRVYSRDATTAAADIQAVTTTEASSVEGAEPVAAPLPPAFGVSVEVFRSSSGLSVVTTLVALFGFLISGIEERTHGIYLLCYHSPTQHSTYANKHHIMTHV